MSSTLIAVGDVIVNRDHPDTMFSEVADVLHSGDVVFGNCETTYSERGDVNPIVRVALRSHPRNVAALKAAGFNVMSFANNHHMGWGYPAYLDTIKHLRAAGIETVGAGVDLGEARRPVVMAAGAVRVAFLAYAPVSFPGSEAGANKPGCPPLRVYTHYQQIEIESPGTNPEVITFADPRDLAEMREDIARARAVAQIVVVGFHWGIHHQPKVIAMYESEVGRAAIDAGADLILGGSQHTPKAIEEYEGRVIFHGLGDFATDQDLRGWTERPGLQQLARNYPGIPLDQARRRRTHVDARMSLIVRGRVEGGDLTQVSYLPCFTSDTNHPELPSPGSERFEHVRSYVEEATREMGFQTGFHVEGGEVVVEV